MFFRKKQLPRDSFDRESKKPIIRASICTGEQVLCSKDRQTGQLTELMLIRKPSELFEFCEANGIRVEDVQKIY